MMREVLSRSLPLRHPKVARKTLRGAAGARLLAVHDGSYDEAASTGVHDGLAREAMPGWASEEREQAHLVLVRREKQRLALEDDDAARAAGRASAAERDGRIDLVAEVPERPPFRGEHDEPIALHRDEDDLRHAQRFRRRSACSARGRVRNASWVSWWK